MFAALLDTCFYKIAMMYYLELLHFIIHDLTIFTVIQIPTDRLHKFQAIAGLLITLAGLTYPAQQYHESEIKYIEAAEQVRLVTNAYNRYAKTVNEMVDIHNKKILENKTREIANSLDQEILQKDIQANEQGREVEYGIVQTQKYVAIGRHYRFIRNMWFLVGVLCVTGGVWLSFIGFRKWLKQPNNDR